MISVARPRIWSTVFALLAFASLVQADDLIVAPPEAPRYELSNLKMEADQFGRAILVCDYQLVHTGTMGTGRISFGGKTSRGELSGFGLLNLDDSGQLRMEMHGIMSGGSDYEIYLVIGDGFRKQYMISNAVRMGNPGPATLPRALNAEELKSIERAKLAKTPPSESLAGYLAVDATTTLVPGMPVKAGYFAEWKDAEVISVKGIESINVKFAGQEHLQTLIREKWIQVDPTVLQKVESDPSQFTASVRALPNSKLVLADGFVPLNDALTLLPGTPLKFDYHGNKWEDVYVLNAENGQIKLRYASRGAPFDETQPRNKFAVGETTLKLLADPETAEKFAKNILGGQSGSDSGWPGSGSSVHEEAMARHNEIVKKMNRDRYPINIPVPKGSQLVPADLKIKKGTPLAGCWGRKWCHITALNENEDGSLHVHWNDYSDAWDCDMGRDQLIIEDKTVAKIETDSGIDKTDSGVVAEELKKTLRTWTDASGQHKVEARLVSKTATEVTLKTDADREIKLSIEKLCEPDKKLLSGIPAKTENPFE